MNKNNSLTFALVIISSGLVIAIGVLIYRTNLLDKIFINEEPVVEEAPQIAPITEDDHILGNPKADVVIIEYADFECPACKEFHNTMRLMMDQFGQDSRIAWVFRQSPLQGEGTNSMRLALLSECISNKYNESKFWQFTNKMYDNAPNSLDKEQTDLILEDINLDPEVINSCVDNLDTADDVNSDLKDREVILMVENSFGTPFNVIKTKNEISTFSGAIPYVMLRDIVEQNSLDFN